MKLEQGQVVSYNKREYVVKLAWGNQSIISPIIGDNEIQVNASRIDGIIRVSPAEIRRRTINAIAGLRADKARSTKLSATLS